MAIPDSLLNEMQLKWEEITTQNSNNPDLTNFQRKKMLNLSQVFFQNVKDRLQSKLLAQSNEGMYHL
jgi:hypothetical protein